VSDDGTSYTSVAQGNRSALEIKDCGPGSLSDFFCGNTSHSNLQIGSLAGIDAIATPEFSAEDFSADDGETITTTIYTKVEVGVYSDDPVSDYSTWTLSNEIDPIESKNFTAEFDDSKPSPSRPILPRT
jgi:hypothetical protein